MSKVVPEVFRLFMLQRTTVLLSWRVRVTKKRNRRSQSNVIHMDSEVVKLVFDLHVHIFLSTHTVTCGRELVAKTTRRSSVLVSLKAKKKMQFVHELFARYLFRVRRIQRNIRTCIVSSIRNEYPEQERVNTGAYQVALRATCIKLER